MVAHNEHTGDLMRSKAASSNYRNNYDAIFGKKENPAAPAENANEPNPEKKTED